MQRFLISVIRPLKINLFLVLLLSFFYTACAFSWGNASAPPRSVSTPSTPTPTTSGIALGVQACPNILQNPALWTPSIALDSNQSVERVLCGYLLGIPVLQAVVMVRHTGGNGLLDIFVYTDITSAHPIDVFSLTGLMHGDAKISGYNTLLTAQEDPNSFYNNAQIGQWTVDLYHEYKWSDTAKSLIQIPFSGIFPDLTRYQAESEQITVNNGRDYQQWRVSAILTTQHFAVKLLKWPSDTPATIVSGGGLHDVHAKVEIKQPASSLLTVFLDRLELNANGGIWEVVDVHDAGLELTLKNAQPLTSPAIVTGSCTTTDGTTSAIEILDHLYSESATAVAWGPNTTGPVTFSKSVPYIVSFKGGTQEGMVILLVSNTSNHMLIGIALLKVLLSA